jgi:hypothetical protein
LERLREEIQQPINEEVINNFQHILVWFIKIIFSDKSRAGGKWVPWDMQTIHIGQKQYWRFFAEKFPNLPLGLGLGLDSCFATCEKL